MNILAIYRHYPPDVAAYSRILQSLLERFQAAGHACHVLTAQPSYNDIAITRRPWQETAGGVAIRRVRLMPERKSWWAIRLLNAVWFHVRALGHLSRRRYDLLLVNTYPPLISGATVWLARRLMGVPYIVHCQDLHPESARLVGRVPAGWLYDLLRRCDAIICRDAAAVVVLSHDMRDALLQRGLPPDNIHVINNFCVPVATNAAVRPIPPLQSPAPDDLHVLFTGNMGSFQGLERILEAARRLRDDPVRFYFVGAGERKAALVRRARELGLTSVEFFPYQPLEVAFATMQQADLAIISLASGVYRVAYPSKSMMYLAAGCPILAIVESDSELAQTVVQRQWGYVTRSFEPADIAEAIRRAYHDKLRRTPGQREALRQDSEQYFGRRPILDRWTKLVASVATSEAA